MARAALFAVLMLSGCHAQLGYYAESGRTSHSAGYAVRVSTDGGDRVLAGIVAGVLVAEGVRNSMSEGAAASGELDPQRPVTVQDCSRRIDPSAGNLMCR